MKLFYSLVILIIFQNCSFDNKTGIWKNENTISKKDKSTFSDFETLSVSKNLLKNLLILKKILYLVFQMKQKKIIGKIYFIIIQIILKIFIIRTQKKLFLKVRKLQNTM